MDSKISKLDPTSINKLVKLFHKGKMIKSIVEYDDGKLYSFKGENLDGFKKIEMRRKFRIYTLSCVHFERIC